MADFGQAYNKTVVGNEGGYRWTGWIGDEENYRGINRTPHPNWQGWHLLDQRKPISNGTVFQDLEPMVQNFYLNNFWQPMMGAFINNQAIANLIFDYFVQTGPLALRKVQEAINTVVSPAITVDGVFGNQTLAAINQGGAVKIHNAIVDKRKAHYENLLNAGIFNPSDWPGILNRLSKYPYLKETLLGGVALILIIGGIILMK